MNELRELLSSPNAIRVNWMEELRSTYSILIEKRERLEDLDVDRRIILKWALKTFVVRARNGFLWLKLDAKCGL
jgi:SPX domain protein involved in polyphosphate accumulation